jgi:DNA polymerase III subunit delta
MARKVAPKPYIPSADHRVVVFTGKETFLRSEYTARLRAVLQEVHGEVDIVRFDGITDTPADILDECRSFGLMQQHKIVLVENADQAVKDTNRPLFIRYTQSPCESATLILRAERWHKSKLDAAVEKAGAIAICDQTTPAMAIRWVQGRCEKRHGAVVDRDAAAMIVDRVGTALGRLDSELGKLALAAEPGSEGQPPRVTVRVVAEFVGRTREEEAWAIQQSLLSGRPEVAIAQLRAILDTSPRGTNIPVSWACADLARKLHASCAGQHQGENGLTLSKVLKLWGPSKDPILSKGAAMQPAQTAALLAAAVEADRQQKTGVGQPDRVLERLALRFTS